MLWLSLLIACGPVPGEADDICAAEFHRTEDVRSIGTQIAIEDGEWPIHVELRWPDKPPRGSRRWPVVVAVHGGWTQQGTRLDEAPPSVEVPDGFVAIHFDLPGGGLSTGTNDRRGAESRAAVAAVLRYAAGQSYDLGGCRLTERALGADGELLYVAGFSNGGNLAVATLADPDLVLPQVQGLILWETPASPQFVTVELGNDPTVYKQGTCALDEHITCSMPTEELVVPFTGTHPACFDRDGDSACGEEDVIIEGVGDPDLDMLYFSEELHDAIDAMGQQRDSFATPAEAEAWWSERDAARLAPDLVAAWPKLPIMLLASEEDHVLSLPDHPHIFGMGEALQRAGAFWTRLNPGRDWLSEVDEENLPNRALELSNPDASFLPEDLDGNIDEVVGASVTELYERALHDDWEGM